MVVENRMGESLRVQCCHTDSVRVTTPSQHYLISFYYKISDATEPLNVLTAKTNILAAS